MMCWCDLVTKELELEGYYSKEINFFMDVMNLLLLHIHDVCYFRLDYEQN